MGRVVPTSRGMLTKILPVLLTVGSWWSQSRQLTESMILAKPAAPRGSLHEPGTVMVACLLLVPGIRGNVLSKL